MSYQNIMSAPLFDFGDIKKSEATIKNTWNEFRIALANKAFKYDEVDSALTTTFLKVFDDLFSNCCAQLECSLSSFQANGYLARGTKLKALETVSYDRFLPKAEFINEDNRFSPVGVEWLYPLKGKVYCGYCQKLMKYRVLKKLGPSFNCRFSATAVDSPCKRIPISEKMLEEIVRNALTVQIKQAEHILEILHERERKALICFSALERQEEKLSLAYANALKQIITMQHRSSVNLLMQWLRTSTS